MSINLGKLEDLIAELAGDPEAENNFFDYSTGASNSNILVAARTVFVKLQPIFDTSLAKELVAIIALLGFPGHLEANLTENKPGEFF